MNKEFQISSKFYDSIYSAKNSIHEVDYILKLAKKFNSNSDYVLDYGCGTARHSKILFEKGKNVIGIDKSSDMIKNAKITYKESQGKKIEILNTNLSSMPSAHFDSVFSIFHVFSYHTKNDEIYDMMQNVKRVLKPNGVFIFDIWYSPAVCYQIPSRRQKVVKLDDSSEIKRICEPIENIDDSLIYVNYEFIMNEENKKNLKAKEVHTMRHFSSNEIKKFSQDVGLTYLHNEEWITGEKPSRETWGVVYVLRK